MSHALTRLARTALLAAGLSIFTTPDGTVWSQTTTTEIKFGFWNVENLFDADDDPNNPGDDEFLPATEWDAARYGRKLEHLAEVVAGLDAHVLGFAEVENRRVLEDLVRQEPLRKLEYQIAHLDSPDKRGIDVALIYRAPLQPLAAEFVELHRIPIDPPTRGVLEVRLSANGHPLHVLVNHWPSRRGGSDSTEPLRFEAARACQAIVKRIVDATPGRDADVLLIGDFNDDPYDPSIAQHLNAVRSRNAVLNREQEGRYRLFNASWKFFGQPDVGTLYYNQEWTWNIFDQCIMSRGLLRADGFEYVDDSLSVYALAKLRDQYGRPLRFRKSGKAWNEGYSDHLAIHGKLRVAAPTTKDASDSK
ncbi:MAG: endonuclease/exonuclease/phosphatase family protein [Planctomycetota bacterium]